jgi:hypothetical protein
MKRIATIALTLFVLYAADFCHADTFPGSFDQQTAGAFNDVAAGPWNVTTNGRMFFVLDDQNVVEPKTLEIFLMSVVVLLLGNRMELMRRTRLWITSMILALTALVAPSADFTSTAAAEIIYESGSLGPTGIPIGVVPGANVSAAVFNGVRFELTVPVVTTHVGGHFVGSTDTTDTFFGAIVQLADENDFPNSGDLSTSDVLGSTTMEFPHPSAEVFGDLALRLDPGWYALVFGSGLFGATGDGAMPLNNPDIGSPTYIAHQPGAVLGWGDLLNPIFRNYRFVVEGEIVPEPSSIALASWFFSYLHFRRRRPGNELNTLTLWYRTSRNLLIERNYNAQRNWFVERIAVKSPQ